MSAVNNTSEIANAYNVWLTGEEIDSLLKPSVALTNEEMAIKHGVHEKLKYIREHQKQQP